MTGIVNNREDVPTGTGPTPDGGGDADGGETPGRAYSSVQRLALLSCCLLFLTYSVAIDGTVDRMMNCIIADAGGTAYQGGRLNLAHEWGVLVRKRTSNAKGSQHTGIRVRKQRRQGQDDFKY